MSKITILTLSYQVYEIQTAIILNKQNIQNVDYLILINYFKDQL